MSLRTRFTLAAVGIVVATACVSAAVHASSTGEIGQASGPSWLKVTGFSVLATTLLCGVPAIGLAAWAAGSVARLFREAADFAEAALAGPCAPSVVLGGGGEADRVRTAIAALRHALENVVTAVGAASERLTNIEADTTVALRHEESAIRAFGGSATEIAAAVTEISATSEQLFHTTGDVMGHAREAATASDEGRAGLERITASILKLDEAMNAFSRKLATISQRAAGITTVVTTIAKVADQTNLLSVNATIEAEKAGESGRGFRIVAQEIRRLADQTGQSTKDIERLVRDMQAAVAGGTMEMDRFRNEVTSRLAEVSAVSEQLGRIIAPVQAVTESLEGVHDGMAAQSEGARQIRTAMESLRGDAAESAASLEAFTSAITAIRTTVADLETATAAFRGQPVNLNDGAFAPDGLRESVAALSPPRAAPGRRTP